MQSTIAHNSVPRKALIKVGDSNTKLQTINDAHLEPGKGFEPHIHNDSEEVYYFLEGEGEMVVNHELFKVMPGLCVLINTNEPHGLKNTGKVKLRFITVRLLI